MPSNTEIAAALGITVQRVGQLVKEGMPTSSLEAAEAWRAGRKGAMAYADKARMDAALEGGGSVAINQEGTAEVKGESGEAKLPDDSGDAIEEAYLRQKSIVRIARGKYLAALREGSSQSGKHYATYDKALATLFKIDKERTARALASRQLITRQTVLDRLKKVLAILCDELEKAETGIAKKANPGNPALAIKALQEFRREVMSRIYSHSRQTLTTVIGGETGDAALDSAEDIAPLEARLEEPTEDLPDGD